MMELTTEGLIALCFTIFTTGFLIAAVAIVVTIECKIKKSHKGVNDD